MLIIRELQLYHFGKFHQQILPLQPGINIVYGENEAGKSTIHRFIKAMLFGVTRLRGKGAANDDYSRFLPWESLRDYEGLMIFEHEGRRYRIYRNFYKEDEQFNVFDDSTGAEIVLQSGSIDELIPGLTEANYRNTISIGQQESRLDDKFAASLQNYMVNMSMSRDGAVDIGKALAVLSEEEKKIKDSMPIQHMEDLKKRMLYERPSDHMKKNTENAERLQQQDAELVKEMDALKEKMAAVRTRERQERMEGMQLLEQRKVLLQSLKKEEERAQSRKDVGLMGQWSFRIFLLLTIAAVVWMAAQMLLQLDSVIYKVSVGVLFLGAFFALAKTSLRKPEDVIDIDSYKEELQMIQDKLAPYSRKFGPQMDGPGYLERLQRQLDQMVQERNAMMKQIEKLAESDGVELYAEIVADENNKVVKMEVTVKSVEGNLIEYRMEDDPKDDDKLADEIEIELKSGEKITLLTTGSPDLTDEDEDYFTLEDVAGTKYVGAKVELECNGDGEVDVITVVDGYRDSSASKKVKGIATAAEGTAETGRNDR